jgi:hypothetical protein
MPDQILVDIIKEHLPYEIDMLRYTYLWLVEMDPASEPNERKACRHALIESFCVHARSLMDFFSDYGSHATDALASEFTFSSFSPIIDQTEEPLKTLKIKFNKQIFHLTQNRTTVEANKMEAITDGKQFLQLIEPAIVHFENNLKTEFRGLFQCNTKPINVSTVPAVPFASLTGTFQSVSLPNQPPPIGPHG